MYSYRDQLEMLDRVRVRENETKRMDCPFCGGRKTFGVARRNGKLMWNCFKASCAVRGIKDTEMSADTVRKRMQGIVATPNRKTDPLPALVSGPENHPKVIRYLEQVNSLEAVQKQLVRAAYAPGEDRILFYTKDRAGAVGRTLSGEKPKWKVYGDVSGLYTVGSGSTAVLVEDIASACSVGRIEGYTGCALLGTNLSSLQRTQLREYHNVLIALDPDASQKSVDLYSRLCSSVRCAIVPLTDDLKWLTKAQVYGVLSGRQ